MLDYDPFAVEENDERKAKMAERRVDLMKLSDSDIQWLMEGGERGRRFVYRLLYVICQLQNPIESNNALQAQREIGSQNVGKWLRNAIERVCPEQWPVMLAEQEHLEKYEHAGRD